jgi:hypothetical protein
MNNNSSASEIKHIEIEIISKDIQVIFKQGQPFLMKIIFIFKNSQEWFNFLNFMNLYSKETGLFFSES